jgi:hypothetical protein
MTVPQRAVQLWPLLAWAARNRQILTYSIVAKLIGVPTVGLGQLLEPIQSYCLKRNLKPLTILVVQQDTGVPGTGFVAAQDIARVQGEVFQYDWVSHGCPTSVDFEEALRSHPSNGVRV